MLTLIRLSWSYRLSNILYEIRDRTLSGRYTDDGPYVVGVPTIHPGLLHPLRCHAKLCSTESNRDQNRAAVATPSTLVA